MNNIQDAVYMKNPLLKAARVDINFTQEQLKEYIKCAESPEYFIENYMKIVTIDKGLQPFKLWDFQKEMVKTFHEERFIIAKLPRQSGKTTCVIGYLLHHGLFNPKQNIAILANKLLLALEILDRLQLAYEQLPQWLQQGVIVWNKGSIKLENGTKYVATGTSSSAVRGGAFNVIFLDEFAHVPNNIAHEFYSSVYPTISSGTTSKMLIVSTPYGMNMFYKLWQDAINGKNKYVPLETHWRDVPGRDEAWKAETIANTSKELFIEEFECEFLGSINTLVSAQKLRLMPYSDPIFSKDKLDIYEKPLKHHIYNICVDVARGKGLDYSACVIVDITDIPYKLVGKYRNNILPPMLFPDVLNTLGLQYNEASILVEVNDIGGQVADILHHDLEYPNVLFSSCKGRGGQTLGGGFAKNIQFGVRTTKQLKRIGCSSLKTLVEEDKLVIPDFDIISELSSFISKNESYQADEGQHDDLVMCLVLFAWMVQQRYFKENLSSNLRLNLLNEHLTHEDLEQLVPFGAIQNGLEDDVFIDSTGESWIPVETVNFPGYPHY